MTNEAVDETVTDIVPDSALPDAEAALPDRRVFLVDSERWEAFLAALDAPPQPRPRLERLFREPSVFEPGNGA